MKSVINNVVYFAIAGCVSIAAYAQGGGGTGQKIYGAGTIVYKNDVAMLRDLADQSDCTPHVTASELERLGLAKQMKEALDGIQKFHPLMAFHLRQKMSQLRWCEVTGLKHIISDDPESVVVNYVTDTQVAIRDIPGKIVYIDTTRLKSLAIDNRIATLLHETNHSFLNLNLDKRNSWLRSLTKAMHDVIYVTKPGRNASKYYMDDMDALVDITDTKSLFNTVKNSQIIGDLATHPSDSSVNQLLRSNLADTKAAFAEFVSNLVPVYGYTRIFGYGVLRDLHYRSDVPIPFDIPIGSDEARPFGSFMRVTTQTFRVIFGQLKRAYETTWLDDLSSGQGVWERDDGLYQTNPVFQFGTCRVEPKSSYDISKTGWNKWRININIDTKFIPKFGKDVDHSFGLKYQYSKTFFDDNARNPEVMRVMRDFKAVHYAQMNELLNKIRAGICEERDQTNLRYFYPTEAK